MLASRSLGSSSQLLTRVVWQHVLGSRLIIPHVSSGQNNRIIPLKIDHLIGVDIKAFDKGSLNFENSNVRSKGDSFFCQPLPGKIKVLKGAKPCGRGSLAEHEGMVLQVSGNTVECLLPAAEKRKKLKKPEKAEKEESGQAK